MHTLTGRERWERDAHLAVGASELAAVLGVDRYRGPLAIYAAKVAKKLDEPERSWLTFGRRVEGAILDGWSDKTGIALHHNDTMDSFFHAKQPRLRATPDAWVRAAGARLPQKVVQAKAVAYAKREDWQESPPQHFEIQVQAEMACAGAASGDLVALIGGVYITDPVTFTPNPGFIAAALEAVERFWWHVTNQQPPEADGKPETRHAINRLWPTDDGRAVALGEDTRQLAEEWEAAKLDKRRAEDLVEELQNRLRARMGDALVAYLPDKSTLTLKKTATGRVLRHYYPHQLKQALNQAHGGRS